MSNYIEGGEFHGPMVQAGTVGELHIHTDGARVVGQLLEESELPSAGDQIAHRVDLDRKALATARSIRRATDADGLQTPWLHTPLSDVLEELASPGTVAARIRLAAEALRRWVDWDPPAEGFRQPTAKRVESALAVWRSQEGDRAECLLRIEELATMLEGVPPESARDDGSTIMPVLERASSAAEAMGVVIRELCAAFKASGPRDDLPVEHVSAERRLFSALQELHACQRQLAGVGIDASLLARATGALLIAGGWGTGKSYGLGAWAEAQVAAGAPVVFVSGRELGGEQWEEEIAGAAAPGGRGGSVRNLLAALQGHARASGKSATLVIDALNDVAPLRGHELDGFASLTVLLREFPEVWLVASTRLDRRMSRDEGAVGAYGIHWASGVADPEKAWELLRDVYQVPALVLPPDVAELRRPLMLTVLAWCLHRERDAVDGDAPVQVPSIGDLFERWLKILDKAPWVWYTVLVNSACREHPAGAGFLHRELRGLKKHQLASRFVVPMLHLLEDRDGMAMVQQFIRWAGCGDDEVRKNATHVTRVLLWLAAVPSPPLRAQCVRTVAQIWRDVPGAAIEHVEIFGKHHDSYIAEASWLAPLCQSWVRHPALSG